MARQASLRFESRALLPTLVREASLWRVPEGLRSSRALRKNGKYTEKGGSAAGMSLANSSFSGRTKLPVVSFRTPLDAAVAVASVRFHNFQYEDFCLFAGHDRLALWHLLSVLEEDAALGRAPSRHAGTQPHRRDDAPFSTS